MLIVLLLSLALAASASVSELQPYQREIVDLKELDTAGECKVATVEKFSELAVDGTLYMWELTLTDALYVLCLLCLLMK